MLTTRTCLFAILLLGTALRIGFCLGQPADLTTDSDGYLAHARMIANGEGFVGPSTHQPTAFRPPAYPVCLGLLMKLGCSDSLSVALINTASGLVILWFTLALALQSGMPVATASCAMIAAALDPLLIRYASLPMTEVPCAAILLAAVVWYRSGLMSLRPSPESDMPADSHPSAVRSFVVAGILFGLGTLLRPVVIVSCALLTIVAVLNAVRNRVRQRKAGNRITVAASATSGFEIPALGFLLVIPALVAALTIAPWIIRNAVTFGHFIPATTHGGYTLALGNNPAFYRDVINGPDEFPWDGQSLSAWQQQMIAASAAEAIPPADESALDAWYYRQAFAAIRAEPSSFLKATRLRVKRFWAISAADTQSLPMLIPAVSTWYGLLWLGLALQLVGCWLHPKSKQFAGSGELWLVVLSFLLMHTMYWTDTRMRAPVMPFLCVLSVGGWSFAAAVASSFLTRNRDKAEILN